MSLNDRTAAEWQSALNWAIIELRRREQEIASRAPLIDNKHLVDARATELRGLIPQLRKGAIASRIVEANSERAAAERELRAFRSEANAARSTIAHPDIYTLAAIKAAKAALAREAVIVERISQASAKAHGASDYFSMSCETLGESFGFATPLLTPRFAQQGKVAIAWCDACPRPRSGCA